MDNKKQVRATAYVAVSRTLKTFIFLFMFSFFGTTSLATVNMDLDTAEYILQYFGENFDLYSNTTYKNNSQMIEKVKEIFNNTSPNLFMNYFNQNFNTTLNYSGDYDFYNLTVAGVLERDNTSTLDFYFSNNTFGATNIPFIDINNRFPAVDIQGTGDYANTWGDIDVVRIRITTNNGFEILKRSQGSYYTNTQFSYNEDNSILYFKPLLALSPVQSVYLRNNNAIRTPYLLGEYYDAVERPPIDIPDSGDTGSGDTGGGGTGGDSGGGTTTPNYNEKLDNIQGSLEDIKENIPTSGEMQNIVSGEVGKITETLTKPADFENKEITSGDILGAINYDPPDDPYANFWLELTNILNNAFTGELKQISIKGYTGKEYIIKTEDITINYPDVLKIFLTLASTAAVGVAIMKWTTTIVEKISSGSMDEVLEANEEGICNLF